MAAITWRNVDGPDFRGAFQGMALANQGINAGFDKFNEVLKQRQDTETANWNQQATNNTRAWLDAVGEAKTPEEYQAKQAFLTQMRQGMGAQIDENVVRATEANQLATLQNRAKSAWEYQNAATTQGQQALRDSIAADIAQGNTTGAQEKIRANPQLVNTAPLYAAIDANTQQTIQRSRDNLDYGHKQVVQEREGELFPLQKDNLQSQIDERRAHAAKLKAEAVDTPAKAQALLFKADAKIRFDEADEKNQFGSKQDYNPDPKVNAANLTKTVNDYFGKDKATAAKVNKYLQENPETEYKDERGNTVSKIGYSKAALLKVLGTTKNTGFMAGYGGGGTYEGNFMDNLKAGLDKEMRDPATQKEYASFIKARHEYQTGTPYGTGVPTNPGLPKPSGETAAPQQNVPTTVLTKAANTTPPKLSELGHLNSLMADAITLPGRALEHGAGTLLNGALDFVAGADIPVTQQRARSSVTTAGWTPFHDMAVAGELPGVPSPNLSLGKSSAFSGTGTLSPSVVAEGKAKLREQLYPPRTPEQAKSVPVKKYAGTIPEGMGTQVSADFLDGDTIKMKSLDQNKAIPQAIGDVGRLAYIDANETAKPGLGKKGQQLGPEALAFLKQAAEGQPVTVRVVGQATRTDTDKTRNVIEMDIGGVPANLLLVRNGLARVSADKDATGSTLTELKKAEDYARTNRLGVWGKEMRSELSADEFRKELAKHR